MILKRKEDRSCSDIHCDLVLLTSCITSRYLGGVGGELDERSSLLFVRKQSNDLDFQEKGISPLCTLWIIQCNMHRCHTLALLTFLYLTVKNSFPLHLFAALVFAITMFQSRLVPTVAHNTQKDRQSFFWCSNYHPYLCETKKKTLVKDIRKCQIQVIFHLSPKAAQRAPRKHSSKASMHMSVVIF